MKKYIIIFAKCIFIVLPVLLLIILSLFICTPIAFLTICLHMIISNYRGHFLKITLLQYYTNLTVYTVLLNIFFVLSYNMAFTVICRVCGL